MRIRTFLFPFTEQPTEFAEPTTSAYLPLTLSIADAVEWFWRYREVLIETSVFGVNMSEADIADNSEPGAPAVGEVERFLFSPSVLPHPGRGFSCSLDSSQQSVNFNYFGQKALGPYPGGPFVSAHYKHGTIVQIKPTIYVRWQADYASIDGKTNVSWDMDSYTDSHDTMALGYQVIDVTIFGETVTLGGTCTENAGANALSLGSATLDITATRWFEYKKDDGSAPVWEETTGVQILDPRIASVP